MWAVTPVSKDSTQSHLLKALALHYLPETCLQMYGECNLEKFSLWKCHGLFQYSAIPKDRSGFVAFQVSLYTVE